MKFENYNINNDIKKQIVEWAAHNRKSGVVKFLLSQLEMPENVEKKEIKTVNLNINNNCDSETIFKNLYTTLLKAGRNITKDDIYNYLISVAQNYIIVLAGEPVQGKLHFVNCLLNHWGYIIRVFQKF